MDDVQREPIEDVVKEGIPQTPGRGGSGSVTSRSDTWVSPAEHPPDTAGIVKNAYTCGYLLLYCRQQFNAENLNFCIAIDGFKSRCQDRRAWPASSLSELESERKSDEDIPWPSQLVSEQVMRKGVQDIVEEYLADSAAQQVMLPHVVNERTQQRIQRIAFYGPLVFDECLADPMRTLERDIMPRFVRSELFDESKTMYSYIFRTVPNSRELDTPPPTGTILDFLSHREVQEKTNYTLQDIVNDRYLFSIMRTYLAKSFNSENLLCVRHISIFDELVASNAKEGAKREAWDIVRYFLRSDSDLEVSSTSHTRRQIGLELADPEAGMFSDVKDDALVMLKADFAKFMRSGEYAELPLLMIGKFVELKGPQRRGNFFNCFQKLE
uniref:RGS domain-containing protein n=2 Tax=Phaeomonas parva TaxID=124430 RepID=A0A7S1XSD3_9STRA|mmetsp:Transcript_34450/g.108510  ORF Transcript_34450/g.108510 Transcript_34450/m.108510 type:complete len:382 (+) Transcript_34450:460-1605(+)|eukprot:CAMPEP_0118853358 /NCGR_PEP_ID=MMETSP1163-20130328/1977_1 /TAXON_ID=124430 /ORGANISM="Phaeomonas parva, Strain CCMP2877" /LENGTH=381 /DNA_ID=CAMNT_0006785901 /DNA_START=209 /DNA_END=1354 /DNA_ORIENTATION=+